MATHGRRDAVQHFIFKAWRVSCCMWVGMGEAFWQVTIFLLFQELGEAFELSPVKIAFGMRTALPLAS